MTDVVTANITLYAKWEGTTSAEENDHFPSLQVYPNPFSGELRIMGAEECLLQVITENGASALSQMITSPNETLNLEHIVQGVYFFRFEKD